MERVVIAGRSEVLVGSWPEPLLPPRPERRQALVLTQPGARAVADEVAGLVEAEGIAVHVECLPDRDAAKTLAVVEGVYGTLTRLGLSRADTVLGVGGGAVTDVAGFIAATWLRGVEAVYVATTLLGAVDAAIGGKTGVNFAGKNLVGAFRHPSRVVVPVPVLEGLPDALLQEGAAEAVKAGAIGDTRLLELYERHGLRAPLEEVVGRAVAVKAAVVNRDFREEGLRAILNFGHTIGHAVEVAAPLTHGHAVAVGMVAAAAVSRDRLAFTGTERLRQVLEGLGLPVSSPPVDRVALAELLGRDKKRGVEGLRMVLLRDFGQAELVPVSSVELEAGFDAVGL